MTKSEMKKKSGASHKAVVMNCWIEAELLILPTRSVTLEEDCLIRLAQLHRNFASNQVFVSDLNSKVQAKFDDEQSLE